MGRNWLILFPLLFDIDGYLKRYAGGLVAQATADLAYRLSSFGDDESSQLHCLAALVYLETTSRCDDPFGDQICARFAVKNPFGGFNLRV